MIFRKAGCAEDYSLLMYPCLLTNLKGNVCRQPCDPFGHHCFCCKITTKTSDHIHARDIICNMTQALGFVTSKEVVVFPWAKKPDVELIDPSGEYLTFYLDVTLPALHQEATASREEIFDNARKAKAKSYPHKDSSGRLISESVCLPFILSSMGGLCKEGHEFLKICKKKNVAATLKMMDVLVTQHSRWTAKRVRRALFGQSLVNFAADPSIGLNEQSDSSVKRVRTRERKKPSRIENSFSQSCNSVSQKSTAVESTFPESVSTAVESTFPESIRETEAGSRVPHEEMPNGTVYFSNDSNSCNVSYFQDFSAFQKQNFQSSFQQPHFPNAHFIQEQFSSTDFLDPAEK